MNLIVAADKNWGIGKDNKLLVSIPSDMKFFRQETMGKVVVMGRKTLESFPNGLPLKNRTNVVLTSDKNYQVKDAVMKDETPKTVWQTTKLVYGIKEIPEDGEDFIVMKSMISKTFSCLEYLYEQELVQRDYRDGRLYYGKM